MTGNFKEFSRTIHNPEFYVLIKIVFRRIFDIEVSKLNGLTKSKPRKYMKMKNKLPKMHFTDKLNQDKPRNGWGPLDSALVRTTLDL